MVNSQMRSEVKKIVEKIQDLAGKMNIALGAGTDVMGLANELVANSITLTFSAGELYTLENSVSVPSTSSVVTNPPATVNSVRKVHTSRYHNLRDNRGRFTSATTV